MELIGLGEVTYVAEDGWWCSEPVSVGALGGVSCVLSFDDVEGTGAAGVVPERLVDAAREMIAADDRALRAATDSIFDYYRDTADEFADDDDVPDIGTADEVWQYVTIGSEVHFSIDQGHAYASIECSCAWEAEHGLQIVFRGASEVVKVGPYDGHLTNAHAYARPDLAEVVYVSHDML